MIKYHVQSATVIKNEQLSTDTFLLTLRSGSWMFGQKLIFQPGQFVLLGLPGSNEAAFSICSSSQAGKKWQVAIRRVGNLTDKLVQLRSGEKVYWRGPFGHGWPMDQLKGQNLLLIGGGCGFIPLRGILQETKIIHYPGQIKIFYGCRNKDNSLFKDEYPKWQNKQKSFHLITEQEAPQGLVTDLLIKEHFQHDALAWIVGPPIMIRETVKLLVARGLTFSNIFFSLERRMCCGVGLCQHCAINKVYVCQDGPVFSGLDWQTNPHLI
ncbi:MAG: hypothetical protein COX77_00805 [Candidatus Komeilibacteria bacterium CG_4_10_14_0_2_um_filter_37_10]|uniref:FAD-binding FR-type domain-containing protein n=1 Tax=Candidatus Komeilibacteria bacterium CG_4_10_14_0_2_um_filter_37_10 TaxID=1974470 RepID=A0A2M7VG77_9BACT|nr:MAG: hypothetical protein COX77_00805 [Candidatus Komeilibacteria bacterium CG_4_10_14_0_2_um_filter_37_10]